MPLEVRETPGNAVHASPVAGPKPEPMAGPVADQTGETKAPLTSVLWRQPWRGFVISTIAAGFLTIIGALGTGQAPFLLRLAYWLLVMNVGALLGAFVSPVIQGWGRLRQRRLGEAALISLVIAVPLTIVLIGANTVFFGNFGGWAEGGVIFLLVWLVSALMTALNYATTHPEVPVAAPGAEAAVPAPLVRQEPVPPQSPRLSARLPLRLQHAAIHALEAEDHYLRVHTDTGSELILLRLSDAIPELDGLDGTQCHRSWWVARRAVADVIKRGGRATLRLDSGIEVPVSRTYLPALRADGWLR